MESSHIAEAVKVSLFKQLENLNPFLLRKTMDKEMIFSINNKTSFMSQRYPFCITPRQHFSMK